MDRKNILLFEPDKEVEKLFNSWLKEKKYKSKSAESIEQILTLLFEVKFDILIIDIDFSENTESLLNLCQILKKDQRFLEFPIMVLTYRKNTKIIANSIEAGIDNFVFKPFEANIFLNRINAILKGIELNSKGKKVLDLNYINYLIKLIIDKIKDILGEPIIVIIIKRLKELIGADYGFVKEVRFSNGKLLIDKVDKISKDVPVEKLTIAFRDFVYGFLQIVQTMTSDIILMEHIY